MLMQCCLRQVKLNDTLVAEGRQGEQQKHCIATGCIRELGDCTVGLVGFGAIARTVVQMLAPFGPKVLYYDPFRADSATEEACHAEYAALETIQKCSDILSLHLAVTPQTVNMVDADSLVGMKDGAFIVNTARGDLVASAALVKALCSGKIAGAGLDTIAPEPVTTENPLLSLPHDRRGDPGGAKRTAAGKYRERVIIKSKTKTPLQLKWKSREGVFACTATAHMGGCYCLFLAGGSGFMASSAVPSSFG